jgi:hypothetical protein
MTSILFSLQATEVAAAALLSLQRARQLHPYVSLQNSVRVLNQALANLHKHLVPKPRAPRRPPAPLQVALPPIPDPSPMRVDHPLATQEVNGCKALLLEVVRRAAYDWVLYKLSHRMQHKKLAEDAYYWLFVEEPGHPRWIERTLGQKSITSFLSICEALDLDPDAVRHHIRRLTVKNVMSVGRPAEYRRTEWREEERFLASGLASVLDHFDQDSYEDDPPNFL